MLTPTARATFIVSTLFTSGVIGGAWAGSAAVDRALDPYAPLDTLVRVLGLIETSYVDEIPTHELVAAAIEGMLARLDPHSTWLDPQRAADLRADTQGEATSIGVEVRPGPDGAVVTRVLPGSPASREGLQPGDRIVEIDGKPVDAAHPWVTDALEGARGDVARLRIIREGQTEPTVVEATRDVVHTPSIEASKLDDDVLYVRIRQFQRGCATELQGALDTAEKPWRSLVLDLRDNPGGLLDEAVAVSDLFLDEGVIVSTWGRLDSERTSHEATPGSISAPITALINGMTASAAEIVASALQDTGRGTLVGTHSYGKGSVQSVFQHRDGSALKLTIARYYTPSGQPVAASDGRKPDVEVPWPSPMSPRARLEGHISGLDVPAAQKAEMLGLLKVIGHGDPEARVVPPWDVPPQDRVRVDPQLATALEVARRGL